MSLHIHRPSQSDEVRAFQSLLIEYLEIRLLQAAALPRLLTTAQATRYVIDIYHVTEALIKTIDWQFDTFLKRSRTLWKPVFGSAASY
jgi:hypothetical protein